MAYNEKLATRVRQALSGYDGLTERKMFGGIGFMLYGNMCCGISSDDLMVRIGPDARDEALAQPYARPIESNGRPMKGFVIVDWAGLEEQAQLDQWLIKGVSFAQSLPKK